MLATDQVVDEKDIVASARADLVTNPQPERIQKARELAIRNVDACSNPTYRAELCTILAQHYHNFAEFSTAYTWLEKARSIADTQNSKAWVAYTHAGILLRERRAQEALVVLDSIVSGSDGIELGVLARAQTTRAGALDSLGLVEEADAAFKSAIELREQLGAKPGLAIVYFNYGEFCMRRDDEVHAMEYLQKTFAIENEQNNLGGIAQTACLLATLHARQSDKSKALELMHFAQESASKAGVPMITAVVKANTAEIFEALHDETSQLTALLDAKTYLDRYPFQSVKGQVLGNLGNMYVNRGDYARAEPLLDEALTISSAEGHRYAQGYWLYVKGRMRNQQARYAEAIPLLLQARDQLAAIQAHVYTLHAFAELARAQAGLGATQEAYRAMAEWASAYTERHSEDVETRMRRVQRLREEERKHLDEEIYRLRNVELAETNTKLEDTNTQLEQTNERLQLANRELIDLASDKDEFMAIAAHDLRNPLADIRSMLQTVIGHYDLIGREDVFDVCRELLSTVTRMEATIHAFLEVSRTDKRSGRLNTDQLDLVRYAHRAAERHSSRADSKDIVINVVADTPTLWAMGDPSIVDAVLDNLVSNALKFSPHDSVVTVLVHTPSAPTISVSDQGPGVANEDLPKLFTKYSRLASRPTGGEGSIGLGLYLAKRMAERMKGTINYEHEPSGGARFSFTMPAPDTANTP